MEEFASVFRAARCVSTPLVAVRTADPAGTTHFALPDNQIGDSTFRQISSLAGDPRGMQFALNFCFWYSGIEGQKSLGEYISSLYS
jgi:hypothetical protein